MPVRSCSDSARVYQRAMNPSPHAGCYQDERGARDKRDGATVMRAADGSRTQGWELQLTACFWGVPVSAKFSKQLTSYNMQGLNS